MVGGEGEQCDRGRREDGRVGGREKGRGKELEGKG